MKRINILLMEIIQLAQHLHWIMPNYYQFSSMHISSWSKSPTRVTCSLSTLIDHILASFPSRVSQKGVINVGLSNHQLIFCTKKISKFKMDRVHKYINLRLLKTYRTDDYKRTIDNYSFQTTKFLTTSMQTTQISFRKLWRVLTKTYHIIC